MAATVTARQLYAALRAAGYSSAAALGIMANAANESGTPGNPLAGYDLDATGDGGASHGLLQWNTAGGGYKSMAGQSLQAQIQYMGQTLPRGCLSLSTAAEVAGCLSENFERCVGCQPGGSQYAQRVANANTLARQSWATAGAASPAAPPPSPQPSPQPSPPLAATLTSYDTGPGASAMTPALPAEGTSDCAWSLSGPTITIIPGVYHQTLGTGCIVSYGEIRAALAIGVLIAAGSGFIVGIALLGAGRLADALGLGGLARRTAGSLGQSAPASGGGNVNYFAAPELTAGQARFISQQRQTRESAARQARLGQAHAGRQARAAEQHTARETRLTEHHQARQARAAEQHAASAERTAQAHRERQNYRRAQTRAARARARTATARAAR